MKSFSDFRCNCGCEYFIPVGTVKKIQLNTPNEYKYSLIEEGIMCIICKMVYKNSKIEEYL